MDGKICVRKHQTPCEGRRVLCLYCGIDLCLLHAGGLHAQGHRCREMLLSCVPRGEGHLGLQELKSGLESQKQKNKPTPDADEPGSEVRPWCLWCLKALPPNSGIRKRHEGECTVLGNKDSIRQWQRRNPEVVAGYVERAKAKPKKAKKKRKRSSPKRASPRRRTKVT